MLVQLKEIPEGQAFRMPWRPPGKQVGKVIRHGSGSTYVHVPVNSDEGGWDYSNFALSSLVEPCELTSYGNQSFGEKGGSGRMLNRSTVEKPVDIVHRLCREMRTSTRDEIVKAAMDLGVNISTAKTQYYAWKKLQ